MIHDVKRAAPEACAARAADASAATPLSPEGTPLSAIGNPLSPEATVELLDRVRGGDRDALERLAERCWPRLRRWARGRLPTYLRDAHDTVDLVSETILASLKQLGHFEVRHEGALQAYLRRALINRINDLIRKNARRPMRAEFPDHVIDDRPSPLEEVLGREKLALYEKALGKLSKSDQELLFLKLELHYDYVQLATACGKPSANAARVAVSRALGRLAEAMKDDAA